MLTPLAEQAFAVLLALVSLLLAGAAAAGRWPGLPGSAIAACSGSGPRTVCSRTGSRPSSCRPTPKFATKLQHAVGLHIDPPEHALVPPVDEKSQIQALDRTQTGCR